MSGTPTPSPSPAPDPRYKYQDLRPTSITVEQLDEMAAYVMRDEKVGWYGWIIQLVKMVFVIAYLIAREKIIDQMAQYLKQQYERRQAGENQNDLDKDDQDGQRRPVSP